MVSGGPSVVRGDPVSVMGVPYTDDEAAEAREWSNRYGPPNSWTAGLGTAARMIGRLLDERQRLRMTQDEVNAITAAMVTADAGRIATLRGLLDRLGQVR